MLATDGERYLRHQALCLNVGDTADELISAADPAEIVAALTNVPGFACAVKEFVDLLLWNPMVAAGRLDGANLAFVDPLFERGIANAQYLGSFAR